MTKPARTGAAIDPDWSIFSAPVHALLQAAEQFGVKRAGLLTAAGIEPGVLDFPESRIPVDRYFKLFGLAEQAAGSADIALIAGRISFLSGLNLQLYMTTICHTFRDYLNLIPSVLKLWGDIGEVRMRAEGKFVRLEWRPLIPATGQQRYLSDAMLAASAGIVGSLCLMPVPVRRAQFSYAEPHDTSMLRQFFGADLAFGQPVSALYFDRTSLDFALIQQNYGLKRDSAVPFADLFDGKNPGDKFWSRLRQSIVRRLPHGDLKQADVASDLGLSARSLQRRLAERSTTFKAQVRDIRSDLARRYLSDHAASITEIAFLLGYGEQSAFSSAFKKWHGLSPSDYQAGHRVGVK